MVSAALFRPRTFGARAELCRQIGNRLRLTADQFEKAENLNLSSFAGTPAPQVGYGNAFGQGGIAQVVTDPSTLGVVAPLTLVEIGGVMAAMSASAAMCPAFWPAVITGGLFVCNIPSLAEAGGKLVHHGESLTKTLNTIFESICNDAADSWKGAGKDAYTSMVAKMKGHLDEVAGCISALGKAVHSLVVALTALWIGLGGLIGPFLVWLIAMWALQAIPGAAAVIQPIINTVGTIMSTTVTTIASSVVVVGGLIIGLINALSADFLSLLALPDDGAQGTPDLTEFRVGTNFAT